MYKIRFLHLFVTLLALILLVVTPAASQPPTGDGVFFEQTGHWVKGPFLALYRQAQDPQIAFGLPITDQFTEAGSGVISQYFSKARFDLVTEANGEHAVLIPLGELLHTAGEPPAIPASGPGCTVQKEGGTPVCYSFMEYLHSNPDAWLLGDAVSDLQIQNGRFMQFFQFGALVWHPEKPAGQRVQLAELGYQYFKTRVGNTDLLAPDMSVALSPGQVTLNANAFPESYILPADGHQSIYIITTDQRHEPLAGASILVTIIWPTGKQDQLRMTELTDTNGLATLRFASNEKFGPNQTISVKLDIQWQGKVVQTGTWFRTAQ